MPKKINLEKKLHDIKKSMGNHTTVFTIGMTKDGNIDIINAESLLRTSKQDAKKESPDEKVSDPLSYIG